MLAYPLCRTKWDGANEKTGSNELENASSLDIDATPLLGCERAKRFQLKRGPHLGTSRSTTFFPPISRYVQRASLSFRLLVINDREFLPFVMHNRQMYRYFGDITESTTAASVRAPDDLHATCVSFFRRASKQS